MRIIALLLLVSATTQAQTYTLPDSLKATGMYVQFEAKAKKANLYCAFGNRFFDWQIDTKNGYATLTIQNEKRNTTPPQFVAYAQHRIEPKWGGAHIFLHPLRKKENAQIATYISIAKDDSGRTHYAFYTNITNNNKWRCVAKMIVPDSSYPKLINVNTKKQLTINNIQVQYAGRGFRSIDTSLYKLTAPSIRPLRDADSIATAQLQMNILATDLKHTNAIQHQGLYYEMLTEGTGTTVQATDTVTIHYKGWNYDTKQVFDKTEKEPATFPLQRLITGWQIGVPLCKVGGKIRLYLPSGLAYGIRNMNNIITPNSILVFEIEVLNTKPKL